jgi:isoquinoline 1-oxidoreductase beta subunit
MGPVLPRRKFLGFLIAGPTLAAAAYIGLKPEAARASAGLSSSAAPSGALPSSIPSPPEVSDLYDLSDLLTDAAALTFGLIKVTANKDGTASFDLPRAEVGQGITTAFAMVVADEMDLPLHKVHITLADANPALLYNQLTGGSNNVHTLYDPVRTAAAAARAQLVSTAATKLGVPASQLSTSNGVVTAKDGRSVGYGALAQAAAVSKTTAVQVTPKATSAQTLIGTPTGRIDAHDIVTGNKVFAMDMNVPNALPAMIARPPTIQGTVQTVHNLAAVKAMPGISHVVVVPIGVSEQSLTGGGGSGVAIVGRTFGHCIDAMQILQVTWGPGTEDHQTDTSVHQELQQAELPLAVPTIPLLAKTVEQKVLFNFISNSPLEPDCAVADVRPGSAEVWACFKVPIAAQQQIALALGLPQNKVVAHVAQGGGSFGRHLFPDVGLEAARVSQAVGQPVRLSYSRTDDFRHGRVHPMAITHTRANYLGGEVLTFEQRRTCVSTDYSHGLDEIISAFADKLPGGNLGVAEVIYETTANVPYNYGVTDQVLNEVDYGFQTGSMRNVYSPDVTATIELVTEQLAKEMGQDSYQFRRSFLKDPGMRAMLDKVATAGNWGRKMAPGTAQGLAVHKEYKAFTACLVEIDNTPATVNRQIKDAYTGPRVTKLFLAVDPGVVINPLGYEAMMQGGSMDGIAKALTMSMHLDNGTWLEGSWDNFYYTRQWNVPPEMEIFIMPSGSYHPGTPPGPGGAGELAVSSSMAATAVAYYRATNVLPTVFPINHDKPLGFTPYPTTPPTPQSPTDGLTHYPTPG